MLGHLGFSYVGLIYLLMLFIPNIIWSKNLPIDYDYSQENKILLLFERIGQVCCSCSILIFSDFNIAPFSVWSLWLIASFLLMILYEICWIRYYSNENTEENFYRSFCGIPVPLASLPVMAFMLLGIYGKVIWLIASAIIIGIGHIGIHIQHLKAIK
ncbi:hypothetical protein [Neobacillus massiliamazoniensis]|jgi:hypothetical protein|uniref:Uncharacterized protein n=1 Tax=Neobacillus massiliamazoniensis TaxID=1499688 RepID=A0A0U1NT86_9BACI|nr:hypothetical protein [Neobacillus massiliamazoniensis]CRK81256.1 hypothetical protein BN000_01156 [Neobacillus massiliamazoniensis]